jgi:hypothetical protein
MHQLHGGMHGAVYPLPCLLWGKNLHGNAQEPEARS